MTFLELQDAVIANRFDVSDRTAVKAWINQSYEWIWNRADWDFKRVAATNFSVSSATPAMPADFAKALRLYDELGDQLQYLEPNEWEALSVQPGATSGGRATQFTVIERQIKLLPTPSSATYKLAYQRRLSHVDASLGIIGGIMVENTDQPLWPAEHDSVLVVAGTIAGQRQRQDPTAEMLVPERDELLESMRRDLTSNVTEQNEQWSP